MRRHEKDGPPTDTTAGLLAMALLVGGALLLGVAFAAYVIRSATQ